MSALVKNPHSRFSRNVTVLFFQFSGQPLLHKAVLHGHAEITQLLADTLIHITKQKVDSIRDQVK